MSTERDSRKDEAVVLIFIFATAGLLIWAAVKPWVGKWVEVRRGNNACGQGSTNMLCRARESGEATYRFRVKAIPEGGVGMSLSGFRLTDHCKTRVEYGMGTAMALGYRHVRFSYRNIVASQFFCYDRSSVGLWVDYPFSCLIHILVYAICRTSSHLIAS